MEEVCRNLFGSLKEEEKLTLLGWLAGVSLAWKKTSLAGCSRIEQVVLTWSEKVISNDHIELDTQRSTTTKSRTP